MTKTDRQFQDVLIKNEITANKQISIGCLIVAATVLLIWILTFTSLFSLRISKESNIMFPIAIVWLCLPYIFSHTKYIGKPWFKYFEVLTLVLMIALLAAGIPNHTILAWAFCIVIVGHYYSKRMMTTVFIVTLVLLAGSIPAAMIVGEWDANLMGISEEMFSKLSVLYPEHPLPHGGINPYDLTDRLYYLNHYSYYSNGLNRWVAAYAYYYAFRVACLTIIYVLSLRLTGRSSKLFISEAQAQMEKGRLNAELGVASQIQLSALPNVFPDTDKFDVYAMTNPAKEVGGDFYNVFIHHDKILFLIADVSGKGMPAALMMMKTNTLICSILKNTQNVADALKFTNRELCVNNERGMFVTALVGAIDLKTGEAELANAGHNPALVRHKGGQFDYSKLPAGFILGGYDNIDYKKTVKQLKNEDTIFIYTDGVTEALNPYGELYGEERLQKLLNSLPEGLSSKETCEAVAKDVAEFAGSHEQADDITLLCLKYTDNIIHSNFVFPADKKEIDGVIAFINEFLEPYVKQPKVLNQIDIAVDEICANIFNYAYSDNTGTVSVGISYNKGLVTINFIDTGKKFNPLEKEDPNINLALEDRKEGGLGIYIVKQLMDDVSYKYTDLGENVLTIKKRVGE